MWSDLAQQDVRVVCPFVPHMQRSSSPSRNPRCNRDACSGKSSQKKRRRGRAAVPLWLWLWF